MKFKIGDRVRVYDRYWTCLGEVRAIENDSIDFFVLLRVLLDGSSDSRPFYPQQCRRMVKKKKAVDGDNTKITFHNDENRRVTYHFRSTKVFDSNEPNSWKEYKVAVTQTFWEALLKPADDNGKFIFGLNIFKTKEEALQHYPRAIGFRRVEIEPITNLAQ